MALPKAFSFTTVLLLTVFSIEIHGYGTYLDYFIEELSGEAKQDAFNDNSDIDYDIELVLSVSDLKALNVVVNSFSLPYVINGNVEITNIITTTVCSPNGGGYQCQCEAQYAWPSSYCSNYGSCDLVFGNNPCDCINAIPANYTSCQPYTGTGNLTETFIELEVFIPINSTPNVTDIFRSELNSLPLPYTIQWGLNITSINLTTVCSPNTTGTVQCTCEAQYGWSCDQCQTYGVCSNSTNSTTDTCSCINNIPPSGRFCEPVTSLTPCPGTTQPPPTPTNMTKTTLNTTIPSPTTNTTTLITTLPPPTPTTTTPPVSLNFSITMDHTFDPTYNNPNSSVFQTISSAIMTAAKNLPGVISANLIQLRSGSIIADYTVIATSSFDATQTNSLLEKISSTMPYPVIKTILTVINDLLNQSKVLDSTTLPQFLGQLAIATSNNSNIIVASSDDIIAIVTILNNVATISSNVSITMMTNVLNAVGILISDQAKNSWNSINTNATTITSAGLLLNSIETITAALTKDSFNIKTPLILLNKTTFGASFSANLNSSVVIDIPVSTTPFNSITTILFKSMNNVLPPRDAKNDPNNTINGNVILVKSNNTVNNVSFTFDLFNGNLSNPLCVFWNFSLFNRSGGWDDMGCKPVFSTNGNVTCNCNHLTSFSILMSPNIPPKIVAALNWITYIGVGISMLSLVICLIIEVIIWRKIRRNSTSYLRHVSLVNIAVSLLIADIWFIIGASISDAHSENTSSCSAATFFIHLFYLALFFWMLASALLLLYRAVIVFGGALTEKSMLAIGFSLGYGAPLIIAIITVAVTAPNNTYTREYQQVNTCWLNWYESKALLAFVIPALSIVAINLVILFIVLYKMLRSRSVADSTRSDDRPVLVVIGKCLAVLTPLFGTTWGLGVGTMVDPSNIGIHVAFAVFNSLQGFFILVFGTLLDKKVRSELAAYSRSSTSGITQSTSANSSNGLHIFRNRRRARDGYNVASTGASNTGT